MPTVFADPFSIYLDDGSSTGNMVVIGTSFANVFFALFTLNAGTEISARLASPAEREVYEGGGQS
jgi:hypothetical protein